jgi:type IV pilus assembly protein PilV
MNTKPQRGFLLIEALIAILIFSLGILGMVAMGGTAIGAQSDARYRTDAARLTTDLASRIALDVDRTSEGTLETTLGSYQHQPGGSNCAFSGTASTADVVTAWVAEATAVLPGVSDANQQVIVSNTAAGHNRVEITVCWKDPTTPSGTAMRRHTLVTYVN